MPAVIMIQNSYSNEDAIERVITYILNSKKAPGYGIYGAFVNLLNTDSVINHFKMIHSIHGKTKGRKLRHIVISFANYEGILDMDVAVIEYYAVNYFGALGHQAIAALHRPITQNGLLHLHIAVNTVNIYDGTKYSGTYTQDGAFFNYLKKIKPYNCLNWEIDYKYSTEYYEAGMK